MINNNLLSKEEFWNIYKKVPRLTVEIVIKNKNGILLTLRDIEPCKNLWHLPGGTVRFGEKLTEAVKRISNRELNVEVLDLKLLGYIEYPSHFENGLDSPVGIVFEVIKFSNKIKLNDESKDSNWFKILPIKMHQEQTNFIKDNLLL